jgi:hypothetical protein
VSWAGWLVPHPPAATLLPSPSLSNLPAGSHRKLRVTANPNITLARSHVPMWCRRARAVLLGPLTLHDVDAASFIAADGGLHP